MTREDALLALDDVDVLIRYCAVHMSQDEARRYNLGGEAFWKVVHWIASMPKAMIRRMSVAQPYSTAIWLARVQGLQSHLRIIARDCESSDDPHVQRLGWQALAGVDEAERYVLDKDWSE